MNLNEALGKRISKKRPLSERVLFQLLKAGSHKYIKREGSKGRYKYTYREKKPEPVWNAEGKTAEETRDIVANRKAAGGPTLAERFRDKEVEKKPGVKKIESFLIPSKHLIDMQRTMKRQESQEKVSSVSAEVKGIGNKIHEAIKTAAIKKLASSEREENGYWGIKFIEPYEGDKKKGTFSILFSIPYEMRHPEEYEDKEGTQREKEIAAENDKMWGVVSKLEKEYPDYEFEISGDTTGSGVKRLI